ncbi:MAG: hypothetical protein K1X67_15780 [Fimbriimonadaceae bacterium]|nr:hypothetical protein [Fimbriimonadaceae bacterium]
MKALPMLLLLVLCGCGPTKEDPSVAGTWASSAATPTKLILNEDRTYRLELNPDVVEGRWLLKGQLLTLSPSKVNGMTQDEALMKSTKEIQEMGKASFDVEKSMQNWDLELSLDGKTLSPAPGHRPGSVVITETFQKQ